MDNVELGNGPIVTQEELCKMKKGTTEGQRTLDIYFTGKDMVETLEYFNNGHVYSIKGLIDYFNKKYKCNKVVKLLEDVILNGITILPKIIFRPITERCKVENGQFKLTHKPYKMGDFWFVNNMVMVKYDDGTYDLFDDVKFDPYNMICSFDNPSISGTAVVTYFKLETSTTGGFYKQE